MVTVQTDANYKLTVFVYWGWRVDKKFIDLILTKTDLGKSKQTYMCIYLAFHMNLT